MAKEMVSLEVEKATYELAMGAGQFIVDLYATLKDGFQPVRDTVAIGSAVVADMVPVLSDFSQLAPELKEDAAAFMAAWMKAGFETYKKLMVK